MNHSHPFTPRFINAWLVCSPGAPPPYLALSKWHPRMGRCSSHGQIPVGQRKEGYTREKNLKSRWCLAHKKTSPFFICQRPNSSPSCLLLCLPCSSLSFLCPSQLPNTPSSVPPSGNMDGTFLFVLSTIGTTLIYQFNIQKSIPRSHLFRSLQTLKKTQKK